MKVLYWSSYSAISELLNFMEPLPITDLSKLNHSIQQIYALHDLDTFGGDALAIVDRLLPSDSIPVFNLTNVRTGQIWLKYLPNVEPIAPELIQVLTQVLSKDRHKHPIAENMPQTFHGAYKISDFMPSAELHQREGLYQQFLKPLAVEDQMLLFLADVNPGRWTELAQANTMLTGFIINRSKCNFTERDRTVLNLLRPHLSQAYTNAQQYQQLQHENNQLQQSLNHLGAIMLNRDLEIYSIAPQAIIWLETYFDQPTCANQLPDHLRSWLKYQITCLKQNTNLQNTCLPLRSQQAGRELTIRLVIEPGEDQYLLILEEQTLSSLQSLTLLGLSQRETEVLALIIQGKRNQAIATHLSIHTSTVRKHLEHIYTRWKVKSRTEAIAHALNMLGYL
jgi:DNA-binding CsgD family transcriptional regulator